MRTYHPAGHRQRVLRAVTGGLADRGDHGPIRVLLLDRQWITRTALHAALTGADDVAVVAVAADGDEAVATIATSGTEPGLDVLVLTGASDPAELVPRLAKALPRWRTRVLVIGGEEFPECLHQCDTAGWLPQSASEEQFVAAVRLVAAGHWVVPAPKHVTAPASRPTVLYDTHGLTAREREVLRLLAHGYTNAEISVSLRLGESTVKSHVQSVLNKIGVRNRVRAAIYAHEIGLLHRDEATATGDTARRNSA